MESGLTHLLRNSSATRISEIFLWNNPTWPHFHHLLIFLFPCPFSTLFPVRFKSWVLNRPGLWQKTCYGSTLRFWFFNAVIRLNVPIKGPHFFISVNQKVQFTIRDWPQTHVCCPQWTTLSLYTTAALHKHDFNQPASSNPSKCCFYCVLINLRSQRDVWGGSYETYSMKSFNMESPKVCLKLFILLLAPCIDHISLKVLNHLKNRMLLSRLPFCSVTATIVKKTI